MPIETLPALAGHDADDFFERAAIDPDDPSTWRPHVQRLAAATGQLHELPATR